MLNGGTMMKDAGETKGLSASFVSAFPGMVYSPWSLCHGSAPTQLQCGPQCSGDGEEPHLSCSWA